MVLNKFTSDIFWRKKNQKKIEKIAKEILKIIEALPKKIAIKQN
jgi:hypothetical protein